MTAKAKMLAKRKTQHRAESLLKLAHWTQAWAPHMHNHTVMLGVGHTHTLAVVLPHLHLAQLLERQVHLVV